MTQRSVYAVCLAFWSGCMWACGESQTTPTVEIDLETVVPQGQQVTFWYQHTREREHNPPINNLNIRACSLCIAQLGCLFG